MNNYQNDIFMIKSDSIVMESLREIALDMPTSERIHYVDIACESIANPETQANIAAKLYAQISSASAEVDFGRIGDSKGDLTKYYYYDQMSHCIEILNEMEGADSIEVINYMNRLHNAILSHREDFVFGYKRGIDIITITYQTMVMTLYCLIDIAICDCTDYIRNSISTQKSVKPGKSRGIMNNTKKMLRLFESGDWNTMITIIKRKSAEMTSEAINQAAATEAAFTLDTTKLGNFLGMAKDAPGVVNPARAIANLWGKANLPIKVVLIFLSLLLCLRGLIYVFYAARARISSWAKHQAELIRGAIDADRDANPDVVARQKKWVDRLEGLADVIGFKLDKAEAVAAKAINASNKADLSTAEITAISGLEFDM